MSDADQLRLPFFTHALHEDRNVTLRKLADNLDVIKHLETASIDLFCLCLEFTTVVPKLKGKLVFNSLAFFLPLLGIYR
jgi:hypothetical protein